MNSQVDKGTDEIVSIWRIHSLERFTLRHEVHPKMSSTNCFFAKVLYALLPKVRVCLCLHDWSRIGCLDILTFFAHLFIHLELGVCIWCGNCGCGRLYNGVVCMAAKQAATSKTPIE